MCACHTSDHSRWLAPEILAGEGATFASVSGKRCIETPGAQLTQQRWPANAAQLLLVAACRVHAAGRQHSLRPLLAVAARALMPPAHAWPWQDVFGFGVVLWELLVWELPWVRHQSFCLQPHACLSRAIIQRSPQRRSHTNSRLGSHAPALRPSAKAPPCSLPPNRRPAATPSRSSGGSWMGPARRSRPSTGERALYLSKPCAHSALQLHSVLQLALPK